MTVALYTLPKQKIDATILKKIVRTHNLHDGLYFRLFLKLLLAVL